ncbi:MAG: hypothetical protein LBU70_08140 [Chitinispirillales bacterium]|nr:hypothetical protein [Chitinispirillales bacterium]
MENVSISSKADELQASFWAGMKELWEFQRKSEEKAEKAREEQDARLALAQEEVRKTREEQDARLALAREEQDKRMTLAYEKAEKARESADKAREEAERAWNKAAESWKNSQRYWDRLNERMGGLNNTIGEIIEMVVIPGVKQKMNEYNYNFTIASPQKEFYRRDGTRLTEVDLLLENCDEVMVVEVKTRFSISWLEKHLQRLHMLRENQSITGMTNRIMYAAVAAIKFDEEAKKLARDSGMYIVEIDEARDKITKVVPPDVEVGKW